jgi:hypothetical protein
VERCSISFDLVNWKISEKNSNVYCHYLHEVTAISLAKIAAVGSGIGS